MGEGYHRGTKVQYNFPTRAKTWQHTYGLHYPTTIKKIDGTELTFFSYEEHHEYIKQLFKN